MSRDEREKDVLQTEPRGARKTPFAQEPDGRQSIFSDWSERRLIVAGTLPSPEATLFTAKKMYRDCLLLVSLKHTVGVTFSMTITHGSSVVQLFGLTTSLPLGHPGFWARGFSFEKDDILKGLCSVDAKAAYALWGV